MVNYKDLGLVNTREMFKGAIKGGYAIPAFNFNNMEQMQAIVSACAETKSPVILQVSSGARKYANQTILRYMAQGAVEYAKELGWEHPQICLHLDHGDTFELLSINSRDGLPPIRLNKMDRTEWYWCWPIKESKRNERDLDAAMKEFGIHHFWENHSYKKQDG